ncbi:MAG: hypothetical protein WDN30_13020 [Pararobbsia sp.]
MSRFKPELPPSAGKRALWFVALWLLGFAGTLLLVLPFHLLVTAAMHH